MASVSACRMQADQSYVLLAQQQAKGDIQVRAAAVTIMMSGLWQEVQDTFDVATGLA